VFLVERQATHLRAHRVGEWLDRIVEAGDRDPAVHVVQRRENACQFHGRIHHRPAVHAAVQVGGGALHADLEVGQPAQ
jgi:hypothetical protein